MKLHPMPTLVMTICVLICAALPSITLAAEYTGTVKVFLVEPKSRWLDVLGDQYQFGFLDFALEAELTIPDGSLYSKSSTWDGTGTDFADIAKDNIMGIAVVFDSASTVGDAFPDNGYWFHIHNADAAASAIPERPGWNTTALGFTHTVFIELAGTTG